MKLILRPLLPLMLMLLAVACEQPQPAATGGKAIRIGVIAPFSGTIFPQGKEGLKGIETARNIQPLLETGEPIELVLKDDRNDPERSVKVLGELVRADQVAAVVTFSSSDAVLAMAAVADTHGTPILAALATHPKVTAGNAFISQVCFSDDFQGKVAALFVRDELLMDRVAVFNNPESRYSSNLANTFKQKFISLDGRITDSVKIEGSVKDLTPILQSLRAKDPELLYMPIDEEDVIRVLKIADGMDWRPQVMGSDGLLANMVTQHSQDLHLLEGMLSSDFFHSDMQLTPYGKKISSVYEGKGTTFSVLGVESYAILIHAMNRCRDPRDRQSLNAAIRETRDFVGVTGHISITADGKAQRPLVINTIRRGKLKFRVQVY